MLDLAPNDCSIFGLNQFSRGHSGPGTAWPIDGATSLLAFHHIAPSERLRTLKEIRNRLKPAMNIVIAGHSAPSPDSVRWMTRSVAFSNRHGADPKTAANTAK